MNQIFLTKMYYGH